ncbi:hypothetical protein BaRGS_00036642 [Batillaria attramentaria]|uniref:Uncharacterized protein n=1 Tax=Batillaria attramentaria TaxID=370345 RepID=A0ABD0JBB9_9CAEN
MWLEGQEHYNNSTMQRVRRSVMTVVAVLSVSFVVHVTAQTNGNNSGGAGHNVGTNHAYTPDGELTGSIPETTSSPRATPTEGEYENTMPTSDNLHTTPSTVGLESTSTPLDYESLARTSPQDTNYTTTLSTRGTPQFVPAPDTYEPLMTRVEPTDYTALTNMGTNQSTAAPENYEPLTMRHSKPETIQL